VRVRPTSSTSVIPSASRILISFIPRRPFHQPTNFQAALRTPVERFAEVIPTVHAKISLTMSCRSDAPHDEPPKHEKPGSKSQRSHNPARDRELSSRKSRVMSSYRCVMPYDAKQSVIGIPKIYRLRAEPRPKSMTPHKIHLEHARLRPLKRIPPVPSQKRGLNKKAKSLLVCHEVPSSKCLRQRRPEPSVRVRIRLHFSGSRQVPETHRSVWHCHRQKRDNQWHNPKAVHSESLKPALHLTRL
jgi:hypothetical protein